MSKRTLIFAAIVLSLGVSKLQAVHYDSGWSNGSQDRWGLATNWSPSIVPNNTVKDTFSVTISSGGIPEGYVKVGLEESPTIDDLSLYGKTELQNWTWHWIQLTVINGLTNYGDLSIDDIDIAGNVTNTPGASLDFGGHFNIFGDLYNAPGAAIDVFHFDTDIEGGTVQNDGFIRATSGGSIGEAIQYDNNGDIFLFDGGSHGRVFNNNSQGIITGSGAITSDTITRNKGAIYASNGSLLLYSDGSLENTGTLGNRVGATLHIMVSAPAVSNQGEIKVNASGAVVFDCNLANDPNGEIELLGGALSATTITQSADADFAGFGSITGDVLIDPNAIITLTGQTNIVGDVTIEADATLEVSDGTTLVTGQTICNGTIHMKGGRIIPQGGLSGNCDIKWEPGLYNNIADFNLDGNVDFADYAYFADTWLWEARL